MNEQRRMRSLRYDFRWLTFLALRTRHCHWHLVRADPGRTHRRSLAPFCGFCSRDFLSHRERISLLTASLLAVGVVVLTRTVDPVKAFAGPALATILLLPVIVPGCFRRA
jgi:hypothetical protein